MIERLRKYHVQLVSFVLILISLQLTRASVDNPNLASFGARMSQSALAPFRSIQYGASLYFKNLWDHYIWLRVVAEENQKLKQDLSLVKRENAVLREGFAEVQSLRDLLKYKKARSQPTLHASVISRSQSNWSGVITIDRGSEDSVTRGDAVIYADAAVGQVISVTAKTAEVLLLTDGLSAIDALVQNSRISGVVEGVGERVLEMSYVVKFKDYLIKPGERVVTSGFDGIFPKGVVIGEVVKVDGDSSALFQKIILEPAVDLQRLEHVLVLTKKGNV